jgi:hypothetical protein
MDLSEDTTTYELRAHPSIKKYSIANFDGSVLPRFNQFPQPVLMYQEPEVPDEEEEEEEKPAAVFRKKRPYKRRNNRTRSWVVEDADHKNKFVGSLEGGQASRASMYMLLVKGADDEFQVIPIDQWYRFKKALPYTPLTLEEAEELNSEKKRSVERWLMKKKLVGEGTGDDEGLVSATRVRTGAVLSKGPSAEAETDMFREPKTTRRKAKAAAEGEEPSCDFKEKFDDDESDTETSAAASARLPMADSESDREGDEDLSKSSKGSLKEVLSHPDKKKDDGEAGADEEDETKEAGEVFVIKRDLGGNIIRTKAEEAEAAGNDATPVVSGSGSGKRKADGSPLDHAAKKARGGGAATGAGAGTEEEKNRLTEANIQKELIRYGGRMKTRDLLKKFKKHLTQQADKDLFRDIIRTICTVEIDPLDGRTLVLKSQFM